MFQSARLKLTFWYAAIILLINATISGLIYYRTNLIINDEFNRIQNRLEEERQLFGLTLEKQVHEKLALENLEQTKDNLMTQLFVINAGITTLVIMFGYVLSSKTLAPIAETMHLQEQFIGDASHELRTPLTSLQTSLEVNISDPKVSQKTKQLLIENLDDVTQLITLTDRLLQLAQPNQNRTISFKPVQMVGIIQSAIKKISPLAQKKHIKIKYDRETVDSSIYVKADAPLLKELLIILLDNAVKYSPTQTLVEIIMTKSKRYISLTVTDQGIGIPPQDMTKIFDRFFQVKTSRTRSQHTQSAVGKGYGLGLSLAKRIADFHGTEISIKSQLNTGTRISFHLQQTTAPKT